MLVKRPGSAVRAAQRGNRTRNEVSAAFRRRREADPPEQVILLFLTIPSEEPVVNIH